MRASGDLTHVKRLTSVLALLGCILHATLLPWHAASAKGAVNPEAAQLAQDLLIICHGDGTGADAEALPAESDDQKQQQAECLICKGLAGFHLVVLAAAELGLLVPPPPARFIAASDDVSVAGLSIQPRSRGPPPSLQFVA